MVQIATYAAFDTSCAVRSNDFPGAGCSSAKTVRMVWCELSANNSVGQFNSNADESAGTKRNSPARGVAVAQVVAVTTTNMAKTATPNCEMRFKAAKVGSRLMGKIINPTTSHT